MVLHSSADLRLLNGIPPVSSVFFYFSFQFVIMHLLISVCTHFHRQFLGRPLSRLSRGLLLNTWLNFPLLPILLTWPIQFNRLILTIESLYKPPNGWIYPPFNRFLQFPFTLIPTHILLKTFLSKAANCLSIHLFNLHFDIYLICQNYSQARDTILTSNILLYVQNKKISS